MKAARPTRVPVVLGGSLRGGTLRAKPLEDKLAQAVRNSLNLPRLRVQVRHSRLAGCWLVCLERRRACSEWLELDPASVAIVKKVGLLPPRLLGTFRLAYDAMTHKIEARVQKPKV